MTPPCHHHPPSRTRRRHELAAAASESWFPRVSESRVMGSPVAVPGSCRGAHKPEMSLQVGGKSFKSGSESFPRSDRQWSHSLQQPLEAVRQLVRQPPPSAEDARVCVEAPRARRGAALE
eukprot:CAMPEP_0113699674 /NCGR_PEP_ID=MMETSP0038_2-20120614/23472_1 /TAXON_ID=2898 /ORGANISM="Cryptomonas paramecium" /LENGTH=119 /DNA_ID=CAMNT_0000623125 /DNA_START=277 /DNA_END=634 /DNA_ORIENTATION=- /assembly_acc=CAM_ASM_000170